MAFAVDGSMLPSRSRSAITMPMHTWLMARLTVSREKLSGSVMTNAAMPLAKMIIWFNRSSASASGNPNDRLISATSGEMPVLVDRSGKQMSLMLPTY